MAAPYADSGAHGDNLSHPFREVLAEGAGFAYATRLAYSFRTALVDVHRAHAEATTAADPQA